jgi:tetratricopeptide (TPR) repeat protein
MRNRTKAGILSAIAVWALLILPALLSPGWIRRAAAETGNAAIDKGVALYDDLEFEQAITALTAAVKQKNLTRGELVEGYKYLALAHVALNHDAEAKDAFRKLLEVSPSYNLPRTESPRALDLFDDVKSVVAPRNVVRLTQTASPARPHRGQPISVSIAVVDEARVHDHVTVYHRVRGQKSYSSVIALPISPGRYNATISGSLVNGPAIEYYVAAEGADNQPLALDGSETEPMVLLIDKEPESKPVYARWWFWAGLGTVLLAGAAVGFVLFGSDPAPTDEGVDVTITVNAP